MIELCHPFVFPHPSDTLEFGLGLRRGIVDILLFLSSFFLRALRNVVQVKPLFPVFLLVHARVLAFRRGQGAGGRVFIALPFLSFLLLLLFPSIFRVRIRAVIGFDVRVDRFGRGVLGVRVVQI